jgi:hypothetical protein
MGEHMHDKPSNVVGRGPLPFPSYPHVEVSVAEAVVGHTDIDLSTSGICTAPDTLSDLHVSACILPSGTAVCIAMCAS